MFSFCSSVFYSACTVNRYPGADADRASFLSPIALRHRPTRGGRSDEEICRAQHQRWSGVSRFLPAGEHRIEALGHQLSRYRATTPAVAPKVIWRLLHLLL